MLDFLKSWKTNVVAAIALIMGILNGILPDYADLFRDVQVFLIAILAFFTKDADRTGTTVNPR